MTLVKIDIRNVASETHPDDRVLVRSDTLREASGGGLISTAETSIPLVNGVGEVDLAPGSVVVNFQCRGISDTSDKRGTVPDEGTVDIAKVIEGGLTFTPPVVNRALDLIKSERDHLLTDMATTVSEAVDGELGAAVRNAETAAVTAGQATISADLRATSAEMVVNTYTPRVVALEAMNGVSPESPVDGQTANLIEQDDTLTRLALDGGFRAKSPYIMEVKPNVNLSDALAGVPSGGHLVLMPNDIGIGRFAISTAVTLNKPITIEGGSDGVDIFLDGGAFVASSDHVVFRNVTFVGSGTSNALANREGENYRGWRFENCRFDGASLDITRRGRTNYLGNVVTSGTGISKGTHIVGCEFTGYLQNYTLEVGGAEDTVITRTWIHDGGLNVTYGDGIKVLDGSSGTKIINNVIENMTRDAIDIYDSYENTIIGNTLRNCELGIDNKWRTGDINTRGRDIISNNHAYDIRATAYNINIAHSLVIGNTAERVGARGFYCGSSVDGTAVPTDHSVFIGNKAISCGDHGFSIGGKGTVVMGNSAIDNAGRGISFSPEASEVTLQGNSCMGNALGDIGNIPAGSVSSGNITSSVPNTGVHIPNNARITSHDSSGLERVMLHITPSGTIRLGDTRATLVQVQAGAVFEVASALRVLGNLQHTGTSIGFYGKTPVSRPTSVPQTIEGIHAALVALGLIT